MKKVIVSVLALILVFTCVCASAETLLIGIPDDGTNLSRGIKLLETAGLIEVDPAAGYTPELKDVTKYIYDIEIMPTTANTLPATLSDFAASTINGTYATSNGLVPSKDGLIIEEQRESDNPYVNIIACRTADAENPVFKTIAEAFQTQLVAEFLLARYEEAYIPAFDYDTAAEPTITKENLSEYLEYSSPKEGKTVVTVGVCGSTNDQWKVVQKVLDDQNANIYLELVDFDAYNLPNDALNAGDIDLNSFQHVAYLEKEVAVNGYDICALSATIRAPLTLYSQKYDSVDAIKEAAGLK